ncbi:MAG: tetratricopeptide repeat protein [Nitrospira sp.]|nr:MAG: tetratricopeptide repeat protein [Nitrospira sp.]
MACSSLAIGETPAQPSPHSSNAVVPERATLLRSPGPVDGLAQPLPDDGPRQEGQSSGIDGLAWQEGQSAYRKNAWPEAQRFFGKIVKEHPESPLAPSAKAFLVEILLRDEVSGKTRSEAIQEYKALLRDHPQSPNARRAEWRIADLYFKQGALQEAQAFYENAMAHSVNLPFDSNRALLGLGYTFMAMGKWSDAEHAFANVRKRSEDEQLLQGATLGLAHALFRAQRFSEAQPIYTLSYQRWPHLLRGDPLSLQRYAVTQVKLHQEASARELMLLFYNLYPRHEYAPAALLHVAEGLRAGAKPMLAEFVYALIPSLYPYSALSTTATLRLAALRAETMLPAGSNSLGLTVSAMIHSVPIPDQTDASYRSLLEEIAAREVSNPMGSEARYYLSRGYESAGDTNRALQTYKEITLRATNKNDLWAIKSAERLSALLTPWIEAAIASRDDLTVVSLFHRQGAMAEQRFARSPVLLNIAESHRRLGFAPEAVRLYQQVLKSSNDSASLEAALIGLGGIYLDQRDPEAARKVLERYRFQFPIGTYETEVRHLLIETMRQQRDLQGLLHLCRMWLLRHPVHPERPAMYVELAKTLGELDKLDESALAYEEAFKAGAVQASTTLVSYADTLSRLNRHERAITAYQLVLAKKPNVSHADWARLQTANHWTALKQYDRATVALAELDVTDDPMLNRLAASLKTSVRAVSHSGKREGL